MSDTTAQNAATNDGEKGGADTSGAGDAFTPITSQDDLNKIIGERVKRAKPADYDDLKAKAAKFDEIEQANKTELEKLTEERDKLRSESESSSLRAARLEVALEKGLTATQAKRLVGTSREEFEADADELLKDLGKTAPPKPNPAQGGDAGVTTSGDFLRDRLAAKQ